MWNTVGSFWVVSIIYLHLWISYFLLFCNYQWSCTHLFRTYTQHFEILMCPGPEFSVSDMFKYVRSRSNCSHVVMHVMPIALQLIVAAVEACGSTVIELSKAVSENASSPSLQWWPWRVMRMPGNGFLDEAIRENANTGLFVVYVCGRMLLHGLLTLRFYMCRLYPVCGVV